MRHFNDIYERTIMRARHWQDATNCVKINTTPFWMFTIIQRSVRPLRCLQFGQLSRGYAAQTQTTSVPEAASRITPLVFKKYKPVSPGLRHLKRPITPHLYEGRPVRDLTIPLRKKGGRNSAGKITIRHHGGGHKQRIRTIDFRRENGDIHDVVRIEYDPGRSAHIALLKNRNPEATGTEKWSYILATDGMRAGDPVQSFRTGFPADLIPGYNVKELLRPGAEVEAGSLSMGLFRAVTLKSGNVLPMRLIPPGTLIHNITLAPEGKMILVRAAGSYGEVLLHEADGVYSHVRLQSGEVRKVLQKCCATIGKVSNTHWKYRELGKAGRARWLGIRPSVRGVAMNAYVSIDSKKNVSNALQERPSSRRWTRKVQVEQGPSVDMGLGHKGNEDEEARSIGSPWQQQNGGYRAPSH